RDQSEGGPSRGHRARAGKSERQAKRRHLDGHGRTQQRDHSGPRHARAVRQGDHDGQRRHREPGRRPGLRRAQLRHDPGARRLGRPASGYLYGTYENPTNAGDGYSMAYHAGAELTGLECYQINPLIKDYNGPACAYVTGPLGGHTVNAKGVRFIESDYWSGQMMMEF